MFQSELPYIQQFNWKKESNFGGENTNVKDMHSQHCSLKNSSSLEKTKFTRSIPSKIKLHKLYIVILYYSSL